MAINTLLLNTDREHASALWALSLIVLILTCYNTPGRFRIQDFVLVVFWRRGILTFTPVQGSGYFLHHCFTPSNLNTSYLLTSTVWIMLFLRDYFLAETSVLSCGRQVIDRVQCNACTDTKNTHLSHKRRTNKAEMKHNYDFIQTLMDSPVWEISKSRLFLFFFFTSFFLQAYQKWMAVNGSFYVQGSQPW